MKAVKKRWQPLLPISLNNANKLSIWNMNSTSVRTPSATTCFTRKSTIGNKSSLMLISARWVLSANSRRGCCDWRARNVSWKMSWDGTKVHLVVSTMLVSAEIIFFVIHIHNHLYLWYAPRLESFVAISQSECYKTKLAKEFWTILIFNFTFNFSGTRVYQSRSLQYFER